jgi:hypothetical protein
VSVYIPEFNSPGEFAEWFIELFNMSYGTTSFFATPEKAKQFVDDYLIKANFSLSNEEVGILLFWSEESYNAALDAVRFSGGSATSLKKKAAVIYWDLIREYIELYSYDPDMIAVVNQGSSAAQDTLLETYDEDVKPSIKIPWWLIAIPFAFLFFKRR